MLKRRHRIGKDAIVAAQKGRIVVRSWAGTLRVSPGPLSFAVVVSKKTEKTAVGRNRLRRRLYEAFRSTHRPQKPFRGVFYPTKEAGIGAFSELTKTVDDMLDEAWSKLTR